VHPLIRILLFLGGAVLVPLRGMDGLPLAAALLAALWVGARVPLDRRAWQAVRRLRWLLISLFVLYAWFTPGRYLLPAWGAWSPTAEGLVLGVERAAALILIALGAHLLLASTRREALVAGLGLLQPRGSRFALRLILTLEAVPRAQARLAAVTAPGLSLARRWRLLGESLRAGEAGAFAPETVAPQRLAWPAPRQWAWLGLLLPLGWSP